jgi:hypothetical protein
VDIEDRKEKRGKTEVSGNTGINSSRGSRVRRDEWILFGVPPVYGNIPKNEPVFRYPKNGQA